MNTVCLYVLRMPTSRSPACSDFEGQNDLRKFVELCRDNDMKVILRPGPYVCAEWEMGGLPWYVAQKERHLPARERPLLPRACRPLPKKVAGQVGDLTVAHGGPIIMVQVENEYGSYGIDKVCGKHPRHDAPQLRLRRDALPVRLVVELPRQRPRRLGVDRELRHRSQHRPAVRAPAPGTPPDATYVFRNFERMVRQVGAPTTRRAPADMVAGIDRCSPRAYRSAST